MRFEDVQLTVHKLRCHYVVMQSIDEIKDDFKRKGNK